VEINKLILLMAWTLSLQGCILTKVVTVLMRLGGTIISVEPVVGNSIDTPADVVDEVPI
jgi:hypothetical protein